MLAALITAFGPPAISGISAAGGVNIALEARRGQSVEELAAAARALIFAANQDPNLMSVFTGFAADVSQVLVSVDTTRAALLGLTPLAVDQTLEANLGGQFVNRFNYQNFVFQVVVQAQSQFRQKISDIDQLYVRSSRGAMVPINALVSIRTIQGADAINSFNLYPAALINGTARPARSTGDAMAAIAQIAAKSLPSGFGFDVGRPAGVGLPLRGGLLVPVPGGALRELVSGRSRSCCRWRLHRSADWRRCCCAEPSSTCTDRLASCCSSASRRRTRS